jgi:hypothetical protein
MTSSHNAPTTLHPFPSGGTITDYDFAAGCAFANMSAKADNMKHIRPCLERGDISPPVAHMDKATPFPSGGVITDYEFPDGLPGFNTNCHIGSIGRVGASLEGDKSPVMSSNNDHTPHNYFPRGGIIAEHDWLEGFSTINKELEAGNMGACGTNFEADNSLTKSTEVKIQHPFPKGGDLPEYEFPEGFSWNANHFADSSDGLGTPLHECNARTKLSDDIKQNHDFPRGIQLTEYEFPVEYALVNRTEHVDGAGPSQELEATDQPLIPELVSPDSTVSMLFRKNPLPGKESFAGRASFPASITATKSCSAGLVNAHQSSASDSSTSRDPGSSHMPSPPHFPKDPALSLMSRGLAELLSDHCRPMQVAPYFNSLISCHKQSDDPETSKPQLHTPLTTSSEREKNEEQERLLALSGISVIATNSKNTVVAVNGEQYSIASPEVWLHPCEEERIVLSHLTQLMRPSFLTSLRNIGAKKAIEAVSGRRLLNQDHTSPTLTKLAHRRSGATESEGPYGMFPISLGEPSLKLTERSDEVSSEVAGYFSNAATNVPTGSNPGAGSIEMDGPGSLERSARFTLRKKRDQHRGLSSVFR